MAKRPVTLLTAMAGADFSHEPGVTLSVDVKVAKAWIDAGIAAPAPDAAAAEVTLAESRDRLAALEAEHADVVADRDALRARAEELGTQLAALTAERDALAAAAKAPAAEG